MEQYGFKFVVDAKDAAKGWAQFKSAIDGVFASLDNMEKHVNKTLNSLKSATARGGDIKKFANQFKDLEKIAIDGTAAQKLTKLRDAMKGFRAPSSTQTNNLRAFFRSLQGVSSIPSFGRVANNIAALSNAFTGFKAPPTSQAKRLAEFAKTLAAVAPKLNALKGITGLAAFASQFSAFSAAMSGFRAPSKASVSNLAGFAHALRALNGNFTLPAGFISALTQLGKFKAPSATQVKNLQGFLNTIGNLKIPPNGAQIARVLEAIALAASRAQSSLRGLRGSVNGLDWGRFNNGARQAQFNMMGLQNAFSLTYQAGSALRTLLGSLTIGEIGRAYFEATDKAMRFTAIMGTVREGQAAVREEFAYISGVSDRFGRDLGDMMEGYQRFSVAANLAGASQAQTRDIFEGFSTAMSVLGTNAAQSQGIMLAMQQVMNKGYLTAEELNQQINEHLPGAIGALRAELRGLGKDLETELRKKSIDGLQALLFLAKFYRSEFGPALEEALMRPSAQMAILKNRVNKLWIAIGEAGGNEAFANLLKKISSYMTPELVQRYATAIGTWLKDAVQKLADAIDWLYNNWDRLKGPMATTLDLLGKWLIVTSAIKITQFLVVPILGLVGALTRVIPLMRQFVTLAKATLTMSIITPVAAGGGAALTGGFAVALAMINRVKLAVVGAGSTIARVFAPVGRLIARAFAPLAPIGRVVMTVLRSFMTMFRWLFSGAGLMGLFAAFTMAGDYARQFGGETYSAFEVVVGAAAWVKDKLVEFFSTAYGYMVQLGQWWNENVGISFGDAWSFVSRFLINLTAGFQTAVNIIYLVFDGFFKWFFGRIGDAITAIAKLGQGDLAGAGSAAWSLVSNGLMGPGVDIARNIVNDFQQNVQQNVEGLGRFGAAAGARGRAAMSGAPSPTGSTPQPQAPGVNDMADLYDSSQLVGNGRGGNGRGRRGRRGRSAADIAEQLRNEVDSVMQALARDNPVRELQVQMVQDLTNLGEKLLQNNALPQYFARLNTDMQSGRVSAQALIDALQSGAIRGDVLADLQRRYGTNVEGIIAMLRNRQGEFAEAVNEATTKEIERTYRQADRVMSVLGENNPIAESMNSFITDISSIGSRLLDPEMFREWITEMRESGGRAQPAIEGLAARLREAAEAGGQMTTVLERYGFTVEDVIQSVENMGRAHTHALQQAREQMQFGTGVLRQMDEEIALARLNNREREVASRLIEEIRRAQKDGIPITQTAIDQLQQQLTLRQRELELLDQQREFYENNGLHRYIADLRTAGQAVHEMDNNFLRNMEDTLHRLGTEGVLDFNTLLDGIQSDLIRFASQGLTRQFLNLLVPNAEGQQNPSIFGGLFSALGFDTGFQAAPQLGTMAQPMWVRMVGGGPVVSVEGAITDALGFSNARATPAIFGGPLGGKGGADGVGVITSVFDTLRQTINGSATDFGSKMADVTQQTGSGFGNIFQNIFGAIGGLFGGGGIGGGGKPGMGGGGGGIGNILMMLLGMAGPLLGGIFAEGGYSSSPVARGLISPGSLSKAPHYAEGTANTSSGGHPAILHDNEAVIPLSRGRKVPVELTNSVSGANGSVVNNNFTINSPDADSFRRSKQQIATDLFVSSSRAARRNK